MSDIDISTKPGDSWQAQRMMQEVVNIGQSPLHEENGHRTKEAGLKISYVAQVEKGDRGGFRQAQVISELKNGVGGEIPNSYHNDQSSRTKNLKYQF